MKTIKVVAAIIKKGSEVLITKRNYGEFKDMWEFPGGKIEQGETKEEALHREIKEELEIEIDNLSFLTTVEYDYDTFHLTMDCYTCEVSSGNVTLSVHNDAKWVHIKDLDSHDWIPADIQIIEKLK